MVRRGRRFESVRGLSRIALFDGSSGDWGDLTGVGGEAVWRLFENLAARRGALMPVVGPSPAMAMGDSLEEKVLDCGSVNGPILDCIDLRSGDGFGPPSPDRR
jgi:hypothetical protein